MSTQALSVLQWLQFYRKKGQSCDYHFIQSGYLTTSTEMKKHHRSKMETGACDSMIILLEFQRAPGQKDLLVYRRP